MVLIMSSALTLTSALPAARAAAEKETDTGKKSWKNSKTNAVIRMLF
ncbi:hypothetical protein X965_13105 [Morganella sp. EGD-HP17]|nr:hypothetical protein X965_13105 [Morganella sp. EGD-HP17]